jgi:hypothetical protein
MGDRIASIKLVEALRDRRFDLLGRQVGAQRQLPTTRIHVTHPTSNVIEEDASRRHAAVGDESLS